MADEIKSIISTIKENSKMSINGKIYEVIAKAFYKTRLNLDDIYVKVFFKDHYVLVISPSDNFIYFGRDAGAIISDFPTPDEIEYNGKKYKKIIRDHQIIVKIEFGSPEEEVDFIDYECTEDDKFIISVGLAKATNKRADIVAEILDINDISIEL